MRRADSFEKTLMLGKIEGRRRRGRQKMRWLDGITDSMEMSLSDGQGSLACCGPWGHEESDMTERLNWTELIAALAQIRSMFTTIPRVFFASLVSMQMYLLLVYLNFFFFLPHGMWDLCSPTMDWGPLEWKLRVLTTGLPENSLFQL